MTNKETIIDGVDVSGCECLMADGFDFPQCRWEIQQSSFSSACEQHDNCYYKQLKRKEQECERLKQEVEKAHNISRNDTEFLRQRTVEFLEKQKKCVKELDQLKADCERINLTNERLVQEKYDLHQDILKLKAELQATKGLVTAISKENFGLIQTQNEIDKKIDKYENALQEIKEIAEKGHKERGNLMRTWWFKDILQKINEVEDV